MTVFAACIFLSAMTLPAAVTDDVQRRPVAFLQEIKGDVTLVRDGRVVKKLNPQVDQGRFLYPGEAIRCGSASSAMGFTADTKRGDFAPANLCEKAPPTGLGSYRGIANAMERAGRSAGRNKGEETSIFAPPDHGAAIATTLVVHWRTRPPLGACTLVLQDAHGAELSRVANIDGATGTLDSQKLRDALVRYAASVGDHTVTLTLHPAIGLDQNVSFTVLTPDQEADLKSRLQEDTHQTGLFHYVERAAVFDSFQLYDEVASEYAAALQQAPNSRDLLEATFNAYARIGDLRTARELRDRLEKAEDAVSP